MRPPSMRKPRSDSSATRIIQPADPVYQVQPPRPDVRRRAVDVGGDDVGLDLVGRDALLACLVDRVQEIEELGCALVAAELGQGAHHPERRVRVLAAVLAHSRHVSLDVAWIVRVVGEGRREEPDELVALRDQVLLHRVHCLRRALRGRRPGDHRPGLRQGIDPAFVALVRAERCPVVVVAATVPLAVPAQSLRARTSSSR